MSRIYNNKHKVTDSILSLFTDASVMEMRLFNERLDNSHPKYKEILYIYAIADIGDECTATDICKLFNVSKAMASQTLNGMERKGFIVREKDPDDHRRHFIKISLDKIDIITKEIQIIDNSADNISKKYTKEELEIATRVLADISAQIRIAELNLPTKK